jgi:hypothetical protein
MEPVRSFRQAVAYRGVAAGVDFSGLRASPPSPQPRALQWKPIECRFVVEDELDTLAALPAIAIEGAEAVGKTRTALT